MDVASELKAAIGLLCTTLTVDDRSGSQADVINRCIRAIGDLQKDKASWQLSAEKWFDALDEIKAIAKEHVK